MNLKEVGVRFDLAQHVLGFANRSVAVAARSFAGYAYLLIGVAPGEPIGADVPDPAILDDGLARFIAPGRPHWELQLAELDRQTVAVIEIARHTLATGSPRSSAGTPAPLRGVSTCAEQVRKLIARVSPEAREHLNTVRRTLQKAGPRVLDHVRDNTFHYPSPDPKYKPTSDEQLQETLAAIAEQRAELFADFEKREVTLTFADEVALALALGQHSANADDLRRQLEIARDGAVAFRAWAEALGVAYFEANDLHFGEPEYKDRCPADEAEDDKGSGPAIDRITAGMCPRSNALGHAASMR